MRLTTFISVCLVLFVQSVSSNDSDDILVSRPSVRRQSRQNYQYNHPPAFEESQEIHVAVVYDEESMREGKILKETPHGNRLPTAPTEEKTKIPGRRVIRKKIGKKPAESEQQIPVVVVYDEKPNITEGNYNKARGQSQRNRQRQTTQKPVSMNQEQKTLAPQKEIKERTTKGEQSRRTERPIVPIIGSEKPLSTNQGQKTPASQKERTTKGESRRERPIIPIIGSENHVYAHTGEFMYSYEGGDGTRAFETGILKSYQDEKSGEAVNGGFSYTDKDGNDFSLSYTADENGYRPVGEHLPTPPPIPPAIARALAYLATKTTPETVTESSSSFKKNRN